MGPYLRANWLIDASVGLRKTYAFAGRTTGNPIFFASTAVLDWGVSPDVDAPTLSISTTPGPNGSLLFLPESVTIALTPAGAAILLAAGTLFQHLLKARWVDGTPVDLIVGWSAVKPGW